jgi:hypothetical protein
MIISIGFGGGVDAILKPIHTLIPRTAMPVFEPRGLRKCVKRLQSGFTNIMSGQGLLA